MARPLLAVSAAVLLVTLAALVGDVVVHTDEDVSEEAPARRLAQRVWRNSRTRWARRREAFESWWQEARGALEPGTEINLAKRQARKQWRLNLASQSVQEIFEDGMDSKGHDDIKEPPQLAVPVENQTIAVKDGAQSSTTQVQLSGSGLVNGLVAPYSQSPVRTLGPILIMYVTDRDTNAQPEKTLAEVRSMLFSSPGLIEAYTTSSWGTFSQPETDVDTVVLEQLHTNLTITLSDIVQALSTLPAARSAVSQRQYSYYMIIHPGAQFAAEAWRPGRWSFFRDGAITYMTLCHELAHNLGLNHAGAMVPLGHEYPSEGLFEPYQDDALMGYQRTHRNSDFNVVARYNLGWIPTSEIASYPGHTHQVDIRALNEGPKYDGNALVMTVPCPSCRSYRTSAVGGTIFLSFRVIDSMNIYGITNSPVDIAAADNASEVLVLEDRVHIHFQLTGDSYTEIWKTLGPSEAYSNSGLHFFVCYTLTKPDAALVGTTEYARVVVSAISKADAISNCGAMPPSPPPSPSAPPAPPSPPPYTHPSPPPAVAGLFAVSDCFAKYATNACLLLGDVAPAAAYAQCYEGATADSARLVLMADLAVGDRVLTATTDGALAATRVLVNQHARSERTATMLVLRTADGTALSLTPNHALYINGKLAAARDAVEGSTLTSADGIPIVIQHISKAERVIINPTTAAGTLLASDEGAPVLAASHPIHVAPAVLTSPSARALINAALVFCGDVKSIGHGIAFAFLKLAATLATIAAAATAFRLRSR